MNRGLETSTVARSIRVLAVGSSWLESTVDAVATDDVSIDVTTALSADATTEFDCVLTDDPDAAASVETTTPVVLVTDLDGASDADRLLSDGVDDVLPRRDAADDALVRHRLRQVVQLSNARRKLDERESWYRTLIERSSTILMVLDEQRRREYVSPAVERITGYSQGELVGGRVDDVVHTDDLDAYVSAFETVLENGPGATASCEYTVTYADGTPHVHEAILTNRLGDPVVDGVVVSIRDVTEHRRVERELSESFERVTDAFFALDAEKRFTYVNERAESILEYEESELLGRGFLEMFPEAEGTKLEQAAIDAVETQVPQTVEACYEPYETWIEARMYPSPSGLSVYFRDISERIEREREVVERTERLEILVENVPVILYALDSTGEFTLSEGRGLEHLDLRPGEVVGESLFDVYADYPSVCEDARRALDGEPVHSRRTIEGRIFETWYRPIVRDGNLERVIGVGVDVTERVQYEQALGALQEATKNLLTVESKQAAYEYVVDTAADALGLEPVVVYRFDERENELVPAAYSTEFVKSIRSPPRLEPGDCIAWETFVGGTPQVFDDVRESPIVYDDVTTARSGLFVPLGEHGVLVTLSPEPGTYDEDTLDLAQLLGATAEAALDRIGRTRRLHDRERELEHQNARLEQLNRAGRIREDVEELLLRADTRAEVERGVCERLVETDEWTFAWIGEPDPGGNHLVPRAAAGPGREYLEAVTVTAVDDDAAEPAGRAAKTRSLTSVDNVAESMRSGTWQAEALSRNLQSVVSIPLVYDDFLYGVLSVYADSREGFDDAIESTFAELGETIAYTIDAVQRKNALMSDEVTEIELEITGESPLGALSERLGAAVSLEGVVPQAEDSAIVFMAVGTTVEADEIEDVEGFDDATVIDRGDEATLLRVRFTEPFLGSIVENHGGTLRQLTADDDGVCATIDVPRSIDVREVLTGINRRGCSVSLLARRERTGGENDTLRRPGRNTLLDELTDRQREVVQAAYHGGFFEWPRRSTGEELADSLEISPPAFHNHVRTVQRKIFSALFDQDRATGGS